MMVKYASLAEGDLFCGENITLNRKESREKVVRYVVRMCVYKLTLS